MKLSKMDLHELTSRRTTVRRSLIAFGIFGVLIAALLIFIKAKLSVFIPVMMLPVTWLPLFIELQAIDKEIKSRNAVS